MNAAIEGANSYLVVKRSLRVEENHLVIFGRESQLLGKVYLFAFGKAACAMSRAAGEVLGGRIEEGITTTKYGYADNCPLPFA